ncbi:hypothetical protein D3C80_1666300 [compost metagenome]
MGPLDDTLYTFRLGAYERPGVLRFRYEDLQGGLFGRRGTWGVKNARRPRRGILCR